MKSFLDYLAVQYCLAFSAYWLWLGLNFLRFLQKKSFCWLVSWLKHEQMIAYQEQQPILQ